MAVLSPERRKELATMFFTEAKRNFRTAYHVSNASDYCRDPPPIYRNSRIGIYFPDIADEVKLNLDSAPLLNQGRLCSCMYVFMRDSAATPDDSKPLFGLVEYALKKLEPRLVPVVNGETRMIPFRDSRWAVVPGIERSEDGGFKLSYSPVESSEPYEINEDEIREKSSN